MNPAPVFRPRPRRLPVHTALRLGVLPFLFAMGSAGEPAPFAWSEPVLVAEGPAGERRWGRYQFPLSLIHI